MFNRKDNTKMIRPPDQADNNRIQYELIYLTTMAGQNK